MSEDLIPVFIKGDNVSLLPLNMKNVNLYVKWENDPKVRLYGRNAAPLTIEDFKKYLESTGERTRSEFHLEIWHNQDKKPIGSTGIFRISWYDRRAYLGLSIGEPQYWGQNLCTEITKLMIEYAFNELNLHKIYAFIAAPNKGSWRCAEKNGFQREGVLKEDKFISCKYIDYYFYSLLKDYWSKLSTNK
jgi:RimJ/RimL family protein N-acetyltransferase